MIKNPILPGFNPDPSICRKDEDYYIAVSSFEWLPGIPVYHSRDLKNWELYTHILKNNEVDLTGLPSGKGIWAPCLTYFREEQEFYVVYGVMNSMNARYFDVDNFVMHAKDIKGPWSRPVYLHSAGFDASIYHGDNGRKWIVSLEWETREGYERPGAICIVEYSAQSREIIGYPRRIWYGGTDRGCIEAPHLTRRGEYYYLMCAEGGTGYGHSVTMARSRNIMGPYEKDPMNPIVTSCPVDFNERDKPDHLKPQYYNPVSYLQKSGHGSYVETSLGEVYLIHLCARPFMPELRCTLGRESAIQKMRWTEDGWLRMNDGSNLAKEQVDESRLPEYPARQIPDYDDFDSEELGGWYYSPRVMPHTFADVSIHKGYVRIRGGEAQTSLNKASILARKLTSVNAQVTTKMEYIPHTYQQNAGLIIYYDNMDYLYVRKYYSETLGQSALGIIQLENGLKSELIKTRIPVEDTAIYLRFLVREKKFWFEWSYNGKDYYKIGDVFDTTRLSDEYCEYGEFTGTFVGITCADGVTHRHYADFDYFEYSEYE